MKKVKITFLLVAVMCLFSSCLVGRPGRIINDGETVADKRMEQVAAAIKTRDKEALKAIFSKKALSEAENFDKRLDYLFQLIQGEVISWESADSSRHVSESIESGHKVKQITSYYYMTTDKQKYFFMLEDFPIDTNLNDNVGLYMLIVVKAEDEEKFWEDGGGVLYPGIYQPLK